MTGTDEEPAVGDDADADAADGDAADPDRTADGDAADPDRAADVDAADPDLATVVGLLDDETARTVLAATAREPRSAADLADLADVSRQTVYRRLDRLTAAGLVTDRTGPRPDGHHETVYEATLSELSVALDEDGFSFDLVREEPDDDAADRLTDLWGNFQR